MAECLVALACVQLLAIDVWVAAVPGPTSRHWGVLGAVTGWVLVAALLLAIPGLVPTAVDIGGGNLAVAVPALGVLSVAALGSAVRRAPAPHAPASLVAGTRSSVGSGRALVVAAVAVPVVLDLSNPSATAAITAWLGVLLAIGLLALPVAELMEIPPSPPDDSRRWHWSQVAAAGALSTSVLGFAASMLG